MGSERVIELESSLDRLDSANANDLEPDSSVTDDSLEDCSPEER